MTVMPASLVTGAAGFVGSHLCERLLQAGHQVIGLDAFTDYYPRVVKEANLATLRTRPDFRFLEVELARADLAPVVAEADFIFHQAGQPGVRASWGKDFDVYVEYNIRATQRLLEAARGSTRLQRLVFASSSSVYGDARDLPLREESPTRPYSPYGVTKLAAVKRRTRRSCWHAWPALELDHAGLKRGCRSSRGGRAKTLRPRHSVAFAGRSDG